MHWLWPLRPERFVRGSAPARRTARRASRRSSGRRLLLECLESRDLLDAVTLTDAEQLLVEYINRARAHPLTEAARWGIDLNAGLTPGTISSAAKPPLAPNQALVRIAGTHTQDMLDHDYFDHGDPADPTDQQAPGKRASKEGYLSPVAENIGWQSTTGTGGTSTDVAKIHEILFKSPAHRQNLLSADFREIGTGLRAGVYTVQGVDYDALMATEDFGGRTGDAFFTGVAYSDLVVPDQFFTAGEGLAQVTISARAPGGTRYTTTTGPSGAFALPVPPGVYDLRAEGGALHTSINISGVVISAANVRVDFVPARTPPAVQDDRGLALLAGTGTIDVLANDSSEYGLNAQSVEIVDLPPRGQATVDAATGQITYTPEPSYVGPDTFTYRVADRFGSKSSPAKVTVAAVDLNHQPWRNPIWAPDVNGDGAVTALDTLLVINELNAHGSRSLPPPSPSGEFPLPYLDVSGDGSIQPLDVLLVINHINTFGSAGEGESTIGNASAERPAATGTLRKGTIVWQLNRSAGASLSCLLAVCGCRNAFSFSPGASPRR